jgi:F420-0:gamma-glutamyl ligase
MADYEISAGRGRTKIVLSARDMGKDVVITIFNENAHIGAVAIAEYSLNEKRASTSVITRLGHKDDVIAQKAAYAITKNTKGTTCVIAGIHLDNITRAEITEIEKNCDSLISQFTTSVTGS